MSVNTAVCSLIDFYNNCSDTDVKFLLGNIKSIFLKDTTLVAFNHNLANGVFSVSQDEYDYERTRDFVYNESYIQAFKQAYISNKKNQRQYTYDKYMNNYNTHGIIDELHYSENPCNHDVCDCKDIIQEIKESDVDYENNAFNKYKQLWNVYDEYNDEYYDEESFYPIYEDEEEQKDEEEKDEEEKDEEENMRLIEKKHHILDNKFYSSINEEHLFTFVSSITQIDFDDETSIEFKENLAEGTYMVHTRKMYDEIESKFSRDGYINGFEHGSEVGKNAGEKMGYEQSYEEIQKIEKIIKKDLEREKKYHKGNPFYQTFINDYNNYKKSEYEYKSDDIYRQVIYKYYETSNHDIFTDITKLYRLLYEGLFEKYQGNYHGIISHYVVSSIFGKSIGEDNKFDVSVKITPNFDTITVEISPNYETVFFEFKCNKKTLEQILKEQGIKKIYDLGLCKDVAGLVYSFL